MSLRVFAEQAQPPIEGLHIYLGAHESHYLRRVRRAKDGCSVEVFVGHQQVWLAQVVDGDAEQSRLLLQTLQPPRTPPRNLVLLLSVVEPSVLLEILRQSCELGVAEINLIKAERSQGAVPSSERIHRVFQAAQRQCGRPSPPLIHEPKTLYEVLHEQSSMPSFFAWEALQTHSYRFEPLPMAQQDARFFVGPEGGITASEITLLKQAGFIPMSLGPWTLRTETAALVGLTRLMFAC